MLLETYAVRVAALFDEIFVSLDGASPATHDAIRGVASFERVVRGVAALRRASARVRITARSTLHARNLHELESIVAATEGAGFDQVSFLPLDASSDAFGGDREARGRLLPTPAQIDAFEAAIGRLATRPRGFVVESPEKLRRLAAHLRASGGQGAFERPACDAPWWSSMVEADGALRPCFFHAAVGDARAGLQRLRASQAYTDALSAIRAPNATCERCVCPKQSEGGLLARLLA
jgi:MoaA/NifB/PqqE/SkfB family radical SAM enzyme